MLYKPFFRFVFFLLFFIGWIEAKEVKTWSYVFFFDNGIKAYVNFSLLPVPAQGQKVACDLSFWSPKWKHPSVGRQYPPERMVVDKEKHRISIKEEYLMEGPIAKGHRVLFSAEKGGSFLLDVSFDSVIRAQKPSQNSWNIEKGSFFQEILIPYGRVSGKIAYNNDTLSVKGYAYADYSVQKSLGVESVSRSFLFSSKKYAGRLGISKKGELFGYALEIEGSQTRILSPKSILQNAKPYDGTRFPNSELEIIWNEPVESLKIDASKVFQKFSVLQNFDGFMAKKAMKFAMGGELLFYRGQTKQDQTVVDWSISGF